MKDIRTPEQSIESVNLWHKTPEGIAAIDHIANEARKDSASAETPLL